MSDEPNEEDIKTHEFWTAAAMCLGYNELAKTAQNLGEKVYWRLSRDKAVEHFVTLGGKSNMFAADETILELEMPIGMPSVRFREKDIELMRATVAAYDAQKDTSKKAQRTRSRKAGK